MNNLDCKKPQPCPKPDITPTTPQPTPAFSVCISDYTLHWDGTHATLERTRFTTDGTYGSITLHDGCVVGYGDCEIPTYTPPYCNPNPAPCNEGVGGGTGVTATVSPRAGNQLATDAYGLYAKAYVEGGTGVTVTGHGTQSSPYTVSIAANAGGPTDGKLVGQGAIAVEERNGVYFVSMPRADLSAGKYGAFNVNEYGVITSIDDNVDMLTTDNVGGSNDVQITKVADGVTIDLAPTQLTANSYRFGGYDVSISDGGRITDATQVARTEAGTYKLGAYNVELDQYGGITGIVQSPEVPQSAGSFTTSDGSKVTYDDTGRIIRVEAAASAGKGPIMDMYKVTRGGGYDHEVSYVAMTSYGTPLEVLSSGGALGGLFGGVSSSFSYKLPAYIKSLSQVEVTRNNVLLEQGRDYYVDLSTPSLSLSYSNQQGVESVYAIVLRG